MAAGEESLEELFSRVSSQLGWEQYEDAHSAIIQLSAKKSTAKKSRLKKITGSSQKQRKSKEEIHKNGPEQSSDKENISTRVGRNKLSLKNKDSKQKVRNMDSVLGQVCSETTQNSTTSAQEKVSSPQRHTKPKSHIKFHTNEQSFDLQKLQQQISEISLEMTNIDVKNPRKSKVEEDKENVIHKLLTEPAVLTTNTNNIQLQNDNRSAECRNDSINDVVRPADLSGNYILDITNDEMESPRCNLFKHFDEKMNNTDSSIISNKLSTTENSGVNPLIRSQNSVDVATNVLDVKGISSAKEATAEQVENVFISSDEYLSAEDSEEENAADMAHISICSESRGSSASSDEEAGDEEDDKDQVFMEDGKQPELNLDELFAVKSGERKDRTQTDQSSDVHSDLQRISSSTIHRSHWNDDDSDSEDEFEKFLNKVKTPSKSVKPKEDAEKLISEFIVSDDDISSGSDDSVLFHLQTNQKLDTPEKFTKPSTGGRSPLPGSLQRTKHFKQSTAKSISSSVNDSPQSLRNRLFKQPKQLKVRPKSESFIDISDDEFDDNVKPSSNIKFRTPQPTKPREKSKPSVTKTKINTDSKPSTVVSSFKSLTSSSASSGSQHLTHSFLRSLAKDISDSSRHPDAVRFVKNFKKTKEELVAKLFTLFNKTVFDQKLPADFRITWNARLRKTAGYCSYKRNKAKPQERSCAIELSGKVCDSADRVRDTLIHELCHAAVWLVNGHNDGHGPFWKYWARKANIAHRELPVIQRCHSYEINTKYIYRCTVCGYQIGRHSKSLNTEKKVCGKCMGTFELMVNSGNKAGPQKPAPARNPNKFAQFVKEHYAPIKQQNGSLTHKEIMNQLSQKFAAIPKITS